MDDSEQDKSEQATPYKLQRARRQGSVARGMDLGFFSGLAAGLGALWLFGPRLGDALGERMRQSLITAPQVVDSHDSLMAMLGLVLSTAIVPVALVAGSIFLAVLTMEIVQVGFVFSTEPLRIDFKRLNPAANLKRLISPKLLIETAKNVFKLVVYGAIAALAVRAALGEVGAIIDAQGLAAASLRLGFRLLAFFALAAVGFAILDQLIVRRDFQKRMRMSRRELRREHKDREGDPRLKRRRKELHGQFVKISQSLRGIRGADVLITNPTHVAVGLRYDPRRADAPVIVAQGANHVAQRLKRLALLYGVTIHADPPLARALYRIDISAEVPSPLYAPIADIYRRLSASVAESAHV